MQVCAGIGSLKFKLVNRTLYASFARTGKPAPVEDDPFWVLLFLILLMRFPPRMPADQLIDHVLEIQYHPHTVNVQNQIPRFVTK